jgi:P-type Mg2+ transporter
VFLIVNVVILIKGLCTRRWIKSLRLAWRVADGIIPELLPAVVNSNLARGALLLFKNKAIVQRPDSVQT